MQRQEIPAIPRTARLGQRKRRLPGRHIDLVQSHMKLPGLKDVDQFPEQVTQVWKRLGMLRIEAPVAGILRQFGIGGREGGFALVPQGIVLGDHVETHRADLLNRGFPCLGIPGPIR